MRNVIASCRDDILQEAFAICRGRDAGDLRNPRLVRLRGAFAASHGHAHLAIAYLTHAINLAQSHPEPYFDLATELSRIGRRPDALSVSLRGLTLAPDDIAAFAQVARLLRQQQRLIESQAICEFAVRLRGAAPASEPLSVIHAELGDVLCARRQMDLAIEHYQTAIGLMPQNGACYSRLGHAHLSLDQLQLALAAFEHGLTCQPPRADLHAGIGEVRLRLGDLDLAASAFRRTLMIAPGDIVTMNRYVFVLERLGRRLDTVGVWTNLGAALERQGRPAEAAAAYAQAQTIKPDCIRACTGVGRTRSALGDRRATLASFERAIAANPEQPTTHVEFGLALHAAGDVDRAWDELAWYHHPSGPDWRRFEQPVWDGARLDGRTVLLWADAPAIDTILFLRYVRFATGLGGRVLVECDRALVPLVEAPAGADHVIVTDGPRLSFDVHAPLRYFPAVVKSARTPLSPPSVPYLRVPDALRQHWQQRLRRDARACVGMVWAGGPEDAPTRASDIASLAAFAALGDLPGARLLSLQRGPHSHELLAPPRELHVEPVVTGSHSMLEIAAILMNLDVVVSVDTAIAHLAAALGRPVCLLLPAYASWPWPTAGHETRWYPTVRLFRQRRNEDWDAVVREIRLALPDLLARQEVRPRPAKAIGRRRRRVSIDRLAMLKLADPRPRAPFPVPGLVARTRHMSHDWGARTAYECDVLDAASEICDEAVAHHPSRVDPLHLSGLLAVERKQDNVAMALFLRALQLDATNASCHLDLGELLARQDAHAEPIPAWRAESLDVRVALGEAFIRIGAHESAVWTLRQALTIDHTHVRATHALVSVLESLGRSQDAAEARLALAEALRLASRYEEALTVWRRVLEDRPDCLPAQLGLAHMLIAIGRPREAHEHLAPALARDPQNPWARIDRATECHLTGDTEHGWTEYAWFYNIAGTVRRAHEQPVWDGSRLDGRTILLWTALGRGDSIQDLRYIDFVRQRGGRIVVESHHAGLVELIERIPGVEAVTTPGSPLPAFDVHAPLVFFPAFVEEARAMTHRVPYLSVDAEKARAWARRLSPRHELLVGISWGGNLDTAPQRFAPLRAFAPLADIANVRFISLQHGPQARELFAPPPGLNIEAVVHDNTSIDDVAALIVNLDLVISVDTMVAHLAGALAIPVWTLLRHATNWRWQAQGDTTRWYPTMRLFRQRQPGDWADVLERARIALEAFAMEPRTARGASSDPTAALWCR